MGKTLKDRLFRTKDGTYVYGQIPNKEISAAFALFILAKLSGDNEILVYAYRVALLYWAYLELFQGVNLYRRILGALVLALVTWSFFT